MYADPGGEFASIIGAAVVGGLALWGAAEQIDRSTDIDPHANMLAAGIAGGGKVVVAAGIAYATFGVGTAALGAGAGAWAAAGAGAASGGAGLFAADIWGLGWGTQDRFSSPLAYGFAIGTGGAFGGGSSLLGRSLGGRAPPYSPSMRFNLVGARSAKATANAQYMAAARDAAMSRDLSAWRSELTAAGVPAELETIGVGWANIPGLRGRVFRGASPSVRKAAGIGEAKPGPLKAPRRNPLFTRHAEEDIGNQMIDAIEKLGLTDAQLTGRSIYMRISNPSGVCVACRQGLSSSAAPGVLKQLSSRFPNLTIRIAVEGGAAAPGRQVMILRGGGYVN
jgi:hypothetical protein